jgi:hypothetical protein
MILLSSLLNTGALNYPKKGIQRTSVSTSSGFYFLHKDISHTKKAEIQAHFTWEKFGWVFAKLLTKK